MGVFMTRGPGGQRFRFSIKELAHYSNIIINHCISIFYSSRKDISILRNLYSIITINKHKLKRPNTVKYYVDDDEGNAFKSHFNEFLSQNDFSNVFILYYLMTPLPVQDCLSIIFLVSIQFRLPLAYLSKLSDAIKLSGNKFSEHWRFFVGINRFCGYFPSVALTEFEVDVMPWLGIEIERDSIANILYHKTFNFIVQNCNIKSDNLILTHQQFADNPDAWARSGSSDGASLFFRLNNKVRKFPRSKQATAYVTHPDRIVHMLRNSQPLRPKVIQKLELGKRRGVAGGGLFGYWTQTWLDQFLSLKSEMSPLFQTQQQYHDKIINICQNVSSSYCVPLDVEHFDWNIRKDEVIAIITGLCHALLSIYRISKHYKEMELTVTALLMSLNDVYIVLGEKRIQWKNGLPSGWKWTALIGTLFSILVCDLALAGLTVVSRYHQGDDSMVMFRSELDVQTFLTRYDQMKIPINRKKFWIDRGRNEFLRKVQLPTAELGYPARGITAICLRNPLSVDAPPGPERLSETLSNWIRFSRRGGVLVNSLLIRDLARGSNLSYDTVSEWLKTPKTLGGGGIGLDGNVMLKYTIKKQNPDIVSEPLGWRKWVDIVGKTVIVQNLRTKLFPGKAFVEIVKFNRSAGRRYVPFGLKSRFPVSCPILPEYPASVARDLFDRLGKEIIPEPKRWMYDYMKQKCTKNIFNDWLKGGLDVVKPFTGKNEESLYSNLFNELIMGSISINLRVGRDTLQAINLYCEYNWTRYAQDYPITFSG